MAKKWYVVSRNGWAVHEGDEQSCRTFVATVVAEYGHSRTDYVLAEGAAGRDVAIREMSK